MDNQQRKSHEVIENLAYTIGFFLGDGCLSSYPFTSSRNGRTYYKNDVAFGKPDLEVLEKVQRQIADAFGKEYGIVKRTLRSGSKYYELTAHRRDIFDFFAVNTRMKAEIPPVLFGASQECRRELLSGLFDSDGHVSQFEDSGRKRWQLGFSNNNRKLVEDTASLLQKLGVRVGRISEGHKAGYVTTYMIHPNLRDWHENGFRFVSRRRQSRVDDYIAHVTGSETVYAEPATPG